MLFVAPQALISLQFVLPYLAELLHLLAFSACFLNNFFIRTAPTFYILLFLSPPTHMTVLLVSGQEFVCDWGNA
jgi:hypothetical protein